MNGLKQVSMALATAGVLASGVAQAALIDRGGGLLYDDILGVTWLQDANYAATQFAATGGTKGDADGLMTWSAAKVWASNLNISRFPGESLSGWRLAANTPVGTSWNPSFSTDGSTDFAFNITSQASELSYMYYVNLGLKGYYSPDGAYQPNFGVFGNGTMGGQRNVYPVKNLRSYAYWSATPKTSSYAWYFDTLLGKQSYNPKSEDFYAWAVRDGNVAAVPEPEVYAMLLAGLGLLGVVARRRKQQSAV